MNNSLTVSAPVDIIENLPAIICGDMKIENRNGGELKSELLVMGKSIRLLDLVGLFAAYIGLPDEYKAPHPFGCLLMIVIVMVIVPAKVAILPDGARKLVAILKRRGMYYNINSQDVLKEIGGTRRELNSILMALEKHGVLRRLDGDDYQIISRPIVGLSLSYI